MSEVPNALYSNADCGDIVETMDVECGGLITCNDNIGMIQRPFEPMAKEVPFDPAVAVLRILQKLQIIHLKSNPASGRVGISSNSIKIRHILSHSHRSYSQSAGKFMNFV